MQPIPVKVKNVSIYPYTGIPIVVQPVLTGASGTYSVGTLTTYIFYNLDLSGGKPAGELSVHGQYYAVGQYEDGSSFTTTWMYCLDNSASPKFGRTVSMLGQQHPAQVQATESLAGPLSVPPYIVLAPLTDITVSQLFPPPAIGQIVLIQGGKGNIIATKTGTPHEMGVEVTGGKRSGQLHNGMSRIIITGKTKDGSIYTTSGLTTVSAGDPAVFFRLFP